MCCSKKRTAPLNPIFYTTASPPSPSYSTTNIYTNATTHQPRSCRRAQHTAHQHPPCPSSLIGYVARKIREGRAPKRTDDNGTVWNASPPPTEKHTHGAPVPSSGAGGAVREERTEVAGGGYGFDDSVGYGESPPDYELVMKTT